MGMSVAIALVIAPVAIYVTVGTLYVRKLARQHDQKRPTMTFQADLIMGKLSSESQLARRLRFAI